MSTYIELEIQNLLNETHDLKDVADRLIQFLESHPDNLTLDNINGFAKFLINADQPWLLVQFVLHYIDNEHFPIPWPYFIEALGMLKGTFDEKTLQALIEGIKEDDAESEVARSPHLPQVLPEMEEWRTHRRYKIQKEYLNNKRLLLDQLITLRTQQLYEQEKNLLQRLQKLYPEDSEVRKEVKDHKQRYALEVLQRRSPKSRPLREEDVTSKDPEVEKALQGIMASLREHAQQDPDMAFDFAIVAYMLESYETALELIQMSERTATALWFELEILLQCRRYVELLAAVTTTELALAHEPETFFATAYLRAQALWGLGQKHSAIEVLEGLMASRPHYRAASALLSLWSGQ